MACVLGQRYVVAVSTCNALSKPHHFHVPAHLSFCVLCLFPQTRGRSGRGEDFAEKAIDFHRRAYVKPGSDGVRQLVLCRVVPDSDHKPCRPKPGCDRSGEVVRVTQLSHVYPEFIVSYTCD